MVNAVAYWPSALSNRYFKTPDTRVQVSFKIPKSLRGHLDALVLLWKMRAELDGEDPKEVDLTYVCERLLQVGSDGAWAEAGKLAGLQGMPSNDDEWDLLKKALVKDAKSKK